METIVNHNIRTKTKRGRNRKRLEKDSKAKDILRKFICRLKQYADAPELTRETCVNLIEYVVIGDRPKDKSTPRRIQIYYKFLDEGYSDAIRQNSGKNK